MGVDSDEVGFAKTYFGIAIFIRGSSAMLFGRNRVCGQY